MQSRIDPQEDILKLSISVSVIIPCYNCSGIVGRAISSVLAQTYPCFEIIIIDDGSDDSEQLDSSIRKFQDPRLRIIRHSKNRYQPAATNTGIQAANGELVAFIDADDEWSPQKLEKQIELWHSLSHERVLIYSQSDVRTEPNQSVGEKIWPQRAISVNESVGDYLFLNRGFLQTSSLLLPRSVALEVQFNESVQKHTDYNFLFRLEEARVSKFMIEEPLVTVHWEDLYLASRGQSPEKSIEFFNVFKQQLTPKAAAAFCLRQIVYRQLRAGNRSQAWRYFSHYVPFKYLNFLDIINLVSLWIFGDERISRKAVLVKRKIQLY